MTMSAEKTRTAPGGGGNSIYHSVAIAVMVVGVILGFAVLPRWFHASEGGALSGKPGPEFQLEVVANAPQDGQRTLALNEYKGKAVVLDFWATWCGPCQAQSPVLDKLAHRYQDQGVAVVGINTSDAPGAAAKWARAHQITYPIVYDDEGEISHAYGVSNLPTLVILSREGKVVAVREGFTDASELESLLKRVL
ncbi:redoxin domain-containing protein [Pendulispora rubella]|uniref:Redoxin domain-containing protein n=1 Tax=Pendulispora rubella TaxID=2741070 RepID=A0ABZ2L4A0_9BACT